MLSICIPVYNVNVSKLVDALQQQVSKLGVPAEIIIIDDHSEPKFSEDNKRHVSSTVKYISLPENIGRARIRNLFLRYAQFSYLLFLDCDSEIIRDNFLSNYLTEINNGTKVICGGRLYPVKAPSGYRGRLHWKYGIMRESKPAAIRQLNPYSSFMTNNFAVERPVFESIQLDERIKGYGHEDTLFGYELKKNKISIQHIDNPVLHAELNTNKVFIENTESALRNLSTIVTYLGDDSDFINDVALLKTYRKLSAQKMVLPLRMFFTVVSPVIRLMLCNGISSIALLNFYKLGYFSRISGI